MEIKQPITFEEQLTKLKARGCVIEDDTFALTKLRQINYYRLTAYYLPFLKEDGTYQNGTSFEKIYRIYEFDRKLRNLILSAVEEIELMLRTQLSYYHAHRYGALGYMDAANFKSYHNHDRFLGIVEHAVTHNSSKLFVQHHLQKYEGKFPLWVIIELFTIGELSCFFSDMHRGDKKTLARQLFQTTDSNVSSWLLCLAKIRNDCAHYARLYYTMFGTVPVTPQGFPYQLRDRVFDYILILGFLYPDAIAWQHVFLPALSALIEEYEDTVQLRCLGFPPNWESLLLSKQPLIPHKKR